MTGNRSRTSTIFNMLAMTALVLAINASTASALALPYCAAESQQNAYFLLTRKSEPVDLPPVSEEAADGATCPSDQVMAGAQCTGHFCDNLTLKCAPMTDDFHTAYTQVAVEDFVAETTDGKAPAFCSTEKAVVGIKCFGRYCDNVRLRCAGFQASVPGASEPLARTVFAQSEADGCTWTPEFTDGSASSQLCPATQFARGIECKGRYCDNMRVYCCPAKVAVCNPLTDGMPIVPTVPLPATTPVGPLPIIEPTHPSNTHPSDVPATHPSNVPASHPISEIPQPSSVPTPTSSSAEGSIEPEYQSTIIVAQANYGPTPTPSCEDNAVPVVNNVIPQTQATITLVAAEQPQQTPTIMGVSAPAMVVPELSQNVQNAVIQSVPELVQTVPSATIQSVPELVQTVPFVTIQSVPNLLQIVPTSTIQSVPESVQNVPTSTIQSAPELLQIVPTNTIQLMPQQMMALNVPAQTVLCRTR